MKIPETPFGPFTFQQLIERENNLNEFYGEKRTSYDERLLFWKESEFWKPFLEANPSLVLLPPCEQLLSFEQRFIHAEKAVELPAVVAAA